jgi:hypothetical protein
MPNELRIGLLAAGAIVIIVAVALGRLKTPAALRLVAALAGAGLMLWAAAPWLIPTAHPRAPPAPPAAAVAPAPGAVAPSPDLVQSASAAILACPSGTAPAVPDGARASRQQMLAASTAFKAYDAATVAYARCIDAAVDGLAGSSAGAPSADEIRALKVFGRSAHNTAVDQEQGVADRLNEQVRIYKDKHRG